MKFTQKPPTKPGIYWAILTWKYSEESSLTMIRLSDNGSVDCLEDAGVECPDWTELKDFVAFHGPVKEPKWSMPKRIINYHRPPKKPATAHSCRRWGHKTVTTVDETGNMFSTMATERCVRCGITNTYNKMIRDCSMAIIFSENKLEDSLYNDT